MLAAGPDDALWLTLNQANAIARVGLDGEVTLHPLPTEAAGPVGITSGGDGALWFVEIVAGQLGRISADGGSTSSRCRTVRPARTRSSPTRRAGAGSPSGPPTASATSTPDGRITGHDLPTPGRRNRTASRSLPDGTVWAALETRQRSPTSPVEG